MGWGLRIKNFFKKNFMTPFFMDGVQCFKVTEPLKFPEIPGTHFIKVEKMKGWVDLGSTWWLWTWELWIENPAPWILGHYEDLLKNPIFRGGGVMKETIYRGDCLKKGGFDSVKEGLAKKRGWCFWGWFK